jgi:hypothetical protein
VSFVVLDFSLLSPPRQIMPEVILDSKKKKKKEFSIFFLCFFIHFYL